MCVCVWGGGGVKKSLASVGTNGRVLKFCLPFDADAIFGDPKVISHLLARLFKPK